MTAVASGESDDDGVLARRSRGTSRDVRFTSKPVKLIEF